MIKKDFTRLNPPPTSLVRYVLVFLLCSTLIACGGGGSSSKKTSTDTSTTIALTGFVTEATGAGGSLAIENVSVKALNADTNVVLETATTNSAGRYSLTLPYNTNVRLLVTPPALVEAPWGGYLHGYFPTSRQLQTGEQNAQLDISLGAASVNTFDHTTDATMGVFGQTSDVAGAQVDVTADSLERADGSAMAEGDVNVLLQPIDVSAETGDSSTRFAGMDAFPGDMLATREDGTATSIASYGAMTVKFFDADGNALQLKEGETATIRIPVPAALQASAQPTIEMWWFNEETGLWVEEGTMELSADKTYYYADVSHFTTWNADIPIEVSDVTATLQYADGTPVRGAIVQLNGVDYAYQVVGISNATGQFTLRARRGYDAQIKVLIGNKSETLTPNISVPDAATHNAGILTVGLDKPEANNGVVEKTIRLVKNEEDYYDSQVLYLAQGLVTGDWVLEEGADLKFQVSYSNPTMGFPFSHASFDPDYTPTRGMQLLNQTFDSLTTAPATGYQDCDGYHGHGTPDPSAPACPQPYDISTATPANKVYAIKTQAGYYGKLVIVSSAQDADTGDWVITVRYKLNVEGTRSL